MEQNLAFQYMTLAAFLLIGAGFCGVVLVANWVLSPHKSYPEKFETYECGSEPVGAPWVQFRVGYYVYALLFVIFDIETAFLFPWAVSLNALPVYVLGEMVVFLVILALGLVYAWKEGALSWR